MTLSDPGDHDTPPCTGEFEIDDIRVGEQSIMGVIFEFGGVTAMQNVEAAVLETLNTEGL